MKTNRISIRSILLGILLLSIGQACTKEWLEAKPDKKLAVPETVKDFQAMLDNYTSLNTAVNIALGEIAADGHYYTDNDFTALLPTYPHHQNAYAWSALTPNETIPIKSDYSAPYTNVLNMNIILNQIEKSKDLDRSGLEQVKAQALFYRGYLFFGLSQIYASTYKSSTANSDLGISLRISTDITERSVRSTTKQTYDQIISDLKHASDILPNVPVFLTRASKPAALGMLARVYLSMGDYFNAFHYANEYLKIKNELLDYSAISNSATFIGVNKEVALLNFHTAYAQITSKYLIDQSLYDSYSANDLRKQVFFQVGAAGITFKGTYGNTTNDVFAGISTDEIYLIRAETNVRNGNIVAGMKDLNDLLRARWAKNPDGTTKYVDQIASDETDALTKILNERKKQLILRNLRGTDLRRLNQDDRFKTTLSRTINGQTFTLEPNSYKYTFPIPNEVIQFSGMQQNPGW
jgi:starch-binding outer membrane protein, SusD/RagB family